MGFETYIFSSKVLSKCRKCRFRDPNFKKFSVVTMASPSLKSWLRHCSLTIPMLETLDHTIRIGSTPNFLYFELYLYSAYAAHYVYFTLLYKIKWFIEFSATSKIDNLTWDFMGFHGNLTCVDYHETLLLYFCGIIGLLFYIINRTMHVCLEI